MIPAPALTTEIDRRRAAPLHRQIYERYRHAIEQGLVKPGERIASARNLAAELGVARGTVEAAYNQLAGEGYLVPRGQAGTVVAPLHALRAPPKPARSAPGSTAPLPALQAPPPFQLGIPALDAFPRKLWARLAARCARATAPADMFYGHPAGHPALRQAIAAYLVVSRGVACAPQQVFVTAGHRMSMGLIARALLKKGDAVWCEDPGYPPACEVLAQAGARVVPVPVDADGLVVAQGVRRAPKARAAVVTPSHQAPLGVSLSLPRRLQLLQWAARGEAWVIEDDYDGEYRYTGPPLPALKSLDAQDRVIYAGTFSKVLFPGLALSYLVVPERLTERFAQACRTASNGPPNLTQAIVAAFIAEGHFSRHLKKMRLLYARRRALLADALREEFGSAIRIDLTAGGMHLILRFSKKRGDERMATRIRAAGMACHSLSSRALAHDCGEGIVIGFTNVTDLAHAKRLAQTLAAALG